MLRGDGEGNLLQIIVDELGFGPGLAYVSASGRLRAGHQDVLGKTGYEGGIVRFLKRSGVTDRC
jgi:hypothetical protein